MSAGYAASGAGKADENSWRTGGSLSLPLPDRLLCLLSTVVSRPSFGTELHIFFDIFIIIKVLSSSLANGVTNMLKVCLLRRTT